MRVPKISLVNQNRALKARNLVLEALVERSAIALTIMLEGQSLDMSQATRLHEDLVGATRQREASFKCRGVPG